MHADYLIFYRAGAELVEVMQVLHGAQDYEPLLFANTDRPSVSMTSARATPNSATLACVTSKAFAAVSDLRIQAACSR